MVRWMLGLGCLGAGTLLALEALYTIKTQKKKRGKKRKEKGLRCFFFNIIWCLFLIASRACKNIYLSFYLKEFFKKSLLGFIFLFLFTFAFVWGMIWSFFSSPPRFFFLLCLFVLFSFLTKRLVNQMFTSPCFLQTMGLGSAALQLIPCPESHNFSWELSSRQSIFKPKKVWKETQWLQTRLLLSVSFLVLTFWLGFLIPFGGKGKSKAWSALQWCEGLIALLNPRGAEGSVLVVWCLVFCKKTTNFRK